MEISYKNRTELKISSNEIHNPFARIQSENCLGILYVPSFANHLDELMEVKSRVAIFISFFHHGLDVLSDEIESCTCQAILQFEVSDLTTTVTIPGEIVTGSG